MDDELAELRREVRRLRDHEEIRQLLYRYARGVDRADLGLIQSVYAEGGTDHPGPFDGPGTEFAHVVVDGDKARAEVYFLACHPHVDNGHPELALMSGRYLDELERRDGGWGIARRTVVSDWTRNHVDGAEWEKTTERGGYVGGRRGGEDPSYGFFG